MYRKVLVTVAVTVVCATYLPCPHACMAAAQSWTQVGMSVPDLQSSSPAQTHPASVQVCGLSGLGNVHMGTLNKQHGPKLAFTTTCAIVSHHTLTAAKPRAGTNQQLKQSASSVTTQHHRTLCEHTGEEKNNLIFDLQ